tara:strand:- start:1512 stop:2852 length:1341 start_codon:yes stop_codon:yes gene_type:complete
MKNKIISRIKSLSHKNDSPHFLLAVSGGIDSMVMLDFFLKNQSNLNFKISVCHINHNYHSKSLKMSKIVLNYCNKNNIEYFNVVLKKQILNNNIESQLRKKRYNGLEKVRKSIGADYIVTAHHFDDQIETALMRILNSSSLDSIMGIKTLNNIIFRPLIDISKDEINLYATKNKIVYGVDPTNSDISLTRNFLRKKVVPLLEKIKPNLAIPFKDLGNKIDDVKDVIDFSTNQFMNSEYIKIDKEIVYIDKNYFLGLPFLMQVSILRIIASEKRKFYFSKNLLRELKAFLRKNITGSIKIINNCIINIDREFIILRISENNNNIYFKVGAGKKVDNDNFYFTWNYEKKPDKFSKDSTIEYVDASKFDKKLLVRSIDKNDKFIPLGMIGTKKVNDYLRDQKRSPLLKSDILAICNNNDIVWVAGERINNKYRITKDSKVVAKLNFLRK